jgi:hypothetical protein
MNSRTLSGLAAGNSYFGGTHRRNRGTYPPWKPHGQFGRCLRINPVRRLKEKLDFLLQEMGRETNTIASKAMDAQISLSVVNIKSELEKIREQVQNIE